MTFRRLDIVPLPESGQPRIGLAGGQMQSGRLVRLPDRERVLPESLPFFPALTMGRNIRVDDRHGRASSIHGFSSGTLVSASSPMSRVTTVRPLRHRRTGGFEHALAS